MNDMKDCSMKWAKREGIDDSALSEWVKAIKHLLFMQCYVISNFMSQLYSFGSFFSCHTNAFYFVSSAICRSHKGTGGGGGVLHALR